MRIYRKAASLGLTLCLLISLLLGCTEKGTEKEIPQAESSMAPDSRPEIDRDSYLEILPKKKESFSDISNDNIAVSQDMLFLVETLEGNHPAFFLDEVPEAYYIQKKYIDENIQELMEDDLAFEYAAYKLTAALNDLHTAINSQTGAYLNLRLKYREEHLLLTEDGGVTNYALKALGGIGTDRLMEIVDDCFAAENESTRHINYEIHLGYSLTLKLAGADMGETVEALFENVDTGDALTLDIPFIYNYPDIPAIEATSMDDVIYVDMNACVPGLNHSAVLSEIKDMVAQGYTKVIVDVRGNHGGNALACTLLLKAIGMKPPSYGSCVPNSQLAKEYLGNIDESMFQEEDYYMTNPKLSVASGNSKISLVVLTDKETLSSASMLGSWVQDGNLGQIVGEISGQAPTFYGDTTTMDFPTKDLSLTIALQKVYRADSAANQEELIPDVEVETGEDALEVALDLLRDE